MPHRFLEGKSVYLSPHDLADIDTYLKWFNDPEVKRTLLLRHAVTRQAEEELLRKAGKPPQQSFFAIHLQTNDQLIGSCDLHVVDWPARVANLGIAIGEKTKWSKGHGTEVIMLLLQYGFGALNLHRIQIEVFDDNPRGIRCYEKCGFKHEGRRREADFIDGKYRDVLLMGILEEEWRASHGDSKPKSRSKA
jgi:RimJ/RimL family protein N-acetyltransferase